MSESSKQGRQPDDFLERWTNDEVVIDLSGQPSSPPQPLPEKVLQWLKAERTRMARLDPSYRAHLESRGIFLTPEELGETEPPASGQAEAAPS